MKKRTVIKTIQGQRAVDGAGVHLVRVFGKRETEEFDPFLMLDSFDSSNPNDYIAGFPMHPHRGIETITYLIEGEIAHEDSLGNKDTIRAGESQWMTAGSGILHQEMPQASERMLGFQLWLNMSAGSKMSEPRYLSITPEMIGQAKTDGADIRVISGDFEGASGITPHHIPATIYDIALKKGKEISIKTKPDETVFVFLMQGNAIIESKAIAEKTAVLFGEGDNIVVSADQQSDLRFIFFSGKPLREPISWGGPIVMNTREELQHAFAELEAGTFIKHQ